MKPNQRYIYYKSLEHKVSVQEFVACSYETHSWWRCAAALETQGQRQEATLPPPPPAGYSASTQFAFWHRIRNIRILLNLNL